MVDGFVVIGLVGSIEVVVEVGYLVGVENIGDV